MFFLFLIFVLTGISLLVQEILGMRITRLTMVGALITCYGSYFFTYSKWANNNIWNKKTSKPVETIKPKSTKTSKADNSNSEYIKIDKKLFNTILIVLGVIVVFYIGYNIGGNSNTSEVNNDYNEDWNLEIEDSKFDRERGAYKYLETEPNNASGYFFRGLERYLTKDYKGAISDLTKSIEMDPNDTYAIATRGDAKEMIGDLKGACEDWKKAAKIGEYSSSEKVKNKCN